MFSESDAEELLNQFPPVEYAFAYGSGAITQGGYDYNQDPASLPMIDMVFVVEDSVAWHSMNMKLNPNHYTPLISLNPTSVAYIQDNFGGNLWYNVGISVNISRFSRRQMKYGVINKVKLLEDLTKWTSLYIAGRLHKPVQILKGNKEIEAAIEINRHHAIRTSLLLLPGSFSETDLFMAVASLSYIGDPRMIVGENPKKVISTFLHYSFLC